MLYILQFTLSISHFSFYILHLTSYTLHVTSFILHPTSYVLHLTSYILHRTSYILHITSYVLYLTSYILHLTSNIVHLTSFQEVNFVHRLQRSAVLKCDDTWREIQCKNLTNQISLQAWSYWWWWWWALTMQSQSNLPYLSKMIHCIYGQLCQQWGE